MFTNARAHPVLAARKMMKFGKWLDEIEKIKYVGRKFLTAAPGWDPWLTAVEASPASDDGAALPRSAVWSPAMAQATG